MELHKLPLEAICRRLQKSFAWACWNTQHYQEEKSATDSRRVLPNVQVELYELLIGSNLLRIPKEFSAEVRERSMEKCCRLASRDDAGHLGTNSGKWIQI